MSIDQKICHITTVHPRFDVRIFYKECRSLADNGFNVKLIVADGLGDELVDRIDVLDIGKCKSRLKRVLFKSFQAFSKAKSIKAQIYQFHDPELIFIGFLLRLSGKKVIYDVHENVPDQILTKPYFNSFTKKVFAKLFQITENILSKTYTGIITATPAIKDRFIAINKHTIDIKNYPELDEIRANNWENKTGNKVCYVGGIFKERGILENIKATSDSIKLLLAGNIPTETFRQELENLPEWKNVHYFGYVNRQEINKILDASKIGLLTLHPYPGYKVSLPIKLFEYMAAGIPVIASDFDLWKDIIEENHCGICVDPLNVSEIQKAIKFLFDNEIKARQMGKNGRNLVIEKYNWKIEEKKLFQFYFDLK